jgi:hypothetical protein
MLSGTRNAAHQYQHAHKTESYVQRSTHRIKRVLQALVVQLETFFRMARQKFNFGQSSKGFNVLWRI